MYFSYSSPGSCYRSDKLIVYAILFPLFIASCIKGKHDVTKPDKEEAKKTSNDSRANSYGEFKSFEKNYCDFKFLEQIADSVSQERYDPNHYNPLFDGMFFFKKLSFTTDTFCAYGFNQRPKVFKNSVKFLGCVLKSDPVLNDEFNIYNISCDSTIYFQPRTIACQLRFSNCAFHDNLSFSFDWSDTIRKSLSFVSCRFEKDLIFENWSRLHGETVKQPFFASDVYFVNNKFNRNIDLSWFTFSGNINFQQCVLPDTINFIGSSFKGAISFTPDANGKKVNLLVGENFPVQQLTCGFSAYNLVFDTTMSERGKEYILRQALESQKRVGTSLDLQEADIALKDYLSLHGDFILSLQKFIWDYGYDKSLLLKRMLYSFLIFYILNLSLFKILIGKVYTIPNLQLRFEELKKFNNRRSRLYKIPLIVFLYSSIIFFGLKMDIDKFSFKHLVLSLYIFFFYLLGLVLLFYFVGIILIR